MLIEARKAAGLTQRALAGRIGRPYTVIANIERGERQIDVVEFIAISIGIGGGELELMRRVAEAVGSSIEL